MYIMSLLPILIPCRIHIQGAAEERAIVNTVINSNTAFTRL